MHSLEGLIREGKWKFVMHKRISSKINFFIKILCVAIFCNAQSAYAGFYTVQVMPLKPAGATKTAMCSDEYEKCYMTLTFPDKKNISEHRVDIVLGFSNGFVSADFLMERERMSTASQGYRYFLEKLPQEGLSWKKIKLYALNAVAKKDPAVLNLLVLRPANDLIAEIALTVQPVADSPSE